MAAEKQKRTNRLIHESSPYLLQHAHNPVDWYPWGKEALEAARQQDKPILLSIGYSACHWCHVMERESFHDPSIADLMNRHFINVKVDREERPDLDSIYMDFIQMTTGSGGWPLTVFLTPDQLPFYGGTYFPPTDRYGRPGFKTILESVAEFYRTRRQEIEENRPEIVQRLEQAARLQSEASELKEERLEEAYGQLQRQFDPVHGGFGGAPKFPSTLVLGFLLRFARRHPSSAARKMVELSLQQMAAGGIYDHLGGGFHRYSVDERWLVPHFEKMLYDNALLARLYLEAFQMTGVDDYRQVAVETLDYIRREMTDPSGGFHSAEDADSEGEEGKFYLWSAGELESVLGKEEAALFADYYGVTEGGNFEGNNILHRRRDLSSLARESGRSEEELHRFLVQCREKLREARARRPRPGRDDKVLASWNGLMLAAFAQAAQVLGESSYLEVALSNADFLAREMVRDGRVLHSWKEGKARLNGYLDDYAHVIEGFIWTYEASGETRWLKLAVRLLETQRTLFADDQEPGFYFTSCDHEPLLVRQKEVYDNATPSGNATSVLNLLRLAELTGNSRYREEAEKMLTWISGLLSRYPLAFGYWLQSLDFFLGPVDQVVVVGPRPDWPRLLAPLHRRFLPNKVVALAEEVTPETSRQIPLLAGKKPIDRQCTVYLCRDNACRQPVLQPSELEPLLEA